MPSRDYGRLAVPVLMLVGICVFLSGVGWGLPSRGADPYLFGEHPIWSGEQILALAGDRGSEQLGADVDRDPSSRGSLLNGTDHERAQIIRRYRLFTYQPDEMITLMAIGSMRPSEGDFDPKLYQYGGLWIYPVAALIKLSGLIHTQAWYLDHPEAFGWFYVLARLYSTAWGLAGIWAAYRLADRSGAGLIGAIGGAMLFMILPVVVNQAHEAKPHLPGAVLILMTSLAAGKFVTEGRLRWWVLTGVLCGAAMGMVVSAAVVFVAIPAMVLLRPMAWSRRLGVALGATGIGLAIYFVINPYVFLHLVGDPQILRSNLSNSAAMYPIGTRLGEGFVNAGLLLAHGTTPVAAVTGLIGAILIFRSIKRIPSPEIAILLLVSGIIFIQFVLLAAGKPGEYARFALVPSIALALSAVIWIGRARIRPFERTEAIVLLIALATFSSVFYLRGYSEDAGPQPRRWQDAMLLQKLHLAGARTLATPNEPAPYNLPPADLFEWNLLLLPEGFSLADGSAPVDVIVKPVDQLRTNPRIVGQYRLLSEREFSDLFPSRISWASKPMEIWVRQSLLEPSTQAADSTHQ